LTAEQILQRLRERGETLATAESLTGGMLGSLITSIPGASDVYVGGVVSYSTDVKERLLHVSPSTISAYGVVSAESALHMAHGAQELMGSTWAVATTGVAGPEEQEGKPVGLVYVAVAGPGDDVRELRLDGDRAAIRTRSCEEALLLLEGLL
jgi:nicotinamide-nucleotide amidase